MTPCNHQFMRVGIVFWSVLGLVCLVIGVWALVDQDWLETTAMVFMLLAAIRGIYFARKTHSSAGVP